MIPVWERLPDGCRAILESSLDAQRIVDLVREDCSADRDYPRIRVAIACNHGVTVLALHVDAHRVPVRAGGAAHRALVDGLLQSAREVSVFVCRRSAA